MIMHSPLSRFASALAVTATSLSIPSPAAAQETQASIAFGARHAVALRTNGDVVTWGDNVGCQLGRAAGTGRGTPGLVLRNVRQVAAAAEHSLALTDEGHVYAWGTQASGWLGVGHEHDLCEGPERVTSLDGKRVVQIGTGLAFSVALTESGEIYCAGSNESGQCPKAKTDRKDLFTAVSLPNLPARIVAIAVGGHHTLALLADGRVYAWGRGRSGELGNGKTANGAGVVQGPAEVESVSAGIWHSAARTRNGDVWLWGDNSRSQMCDGTTANRPVPAQLASIPSKIRRMVAGGHSTLFETADAGVYACGDNTEGALGVALRTVSEPTRVQSPTASSRVLGVGVRNAALSSDGCGVLVAGDATAGVAGSPGGATANRTFAAHAGLSICAPRAAARGMDIVNPQPSGGESGCWAPTVEDGAPGRSAQRQAFLGAEALLKSNAALMAPLEPVRFRTTLAIGHADSDSQMRVHVVPERKADRTRLWMAGCGVTPHLNRIGGAVSQISFTINEDASAFIGATGRVSKVPKLTGRFGGFPEYDGKVVVTKDGRLPWIPVTLAEALDALATERARALAEARRRDGVTLPVDPLATAKLYKQIKDTHPVSAKFLAGMRAADSATTPGGVSVALSALERRVREVVTYRASFTADQLAAPGVWADSAGVGKKELDSRVAALRALPPDVQREINARGGAASMVRTLKAAHQERVTSQVDDAVAQFELTNLRPGRAEDANGFKPDPAFFDRRNPDRIRMITVSFSLDPDTRQTERRAWQLRVKATFDFAALAALVQ